MKFRPSRVELDGDIARVELTRGLWAIIDAVDVPIVAGRSWTTQGSKNRPGKVYAFSGNTSMHRAIAKPAHGEHVDHRDDDGLNNRRANLRACTPALHVRHRGVQANNALGVRGVRVTPYGLFRVEIRINKQKIELGTYKTLEEAKVAYAQGAEKYFGEFAHRSVLTTA